MLAHETTAPSDVVVENQPRQRRHTQAMLVLTRRVDEDVLLTLPDGQRVRIHVAAVVGDKVRLAFDAPDEVVVNRAEVQDRIDAGQP